tara:strand:+ start:3914 stop:4699 length:786 start_codon:yes stop_codon:yes gene_type:complete
MRKVFSILAATLFAGTAFAEAPGMVTSPLTGEVEIKITQDANDNWGGAMGLDLGIDAAGMAAVDLDFSAVDGGAVTLDNWTVGTEVNSIGIAIGDDNGVMPDAEGNHTLAAPAMTESVSVTAGAASVAMGWTDWTTDVTDISNIQGSYTMDMSAFELTAAGDYNMDTENTILGAGISNFGLGGASLGGAMSYDMDAEKFAYEGTAGISGVTAYMNGDQDDALQNIGGEYTYMLGGAELEAGANYNIDSEDLTPTVSIGFSF